MQQRASGRQSGRKTSSKSIRRINLSALSENQSDVYRRVLDAIKLSREHPGYSLERVAHEAATTSQTIKRYAPSVWEKYGGHLRAKPIDRLPRTLWLLNSKGRYRLLTHSSKTASLIGRYHNALKAFVYYGDAKALDGFRGRSVVIGGVKHEFLTDLHAISRLARAGELHMLDIYASEVD